MNYRVLFFAICMVWGLSELLLVVFRRSTATSQKRDSGSVVWLNLIIYGSIALGVGAALTGVGRIAMLGNLLPWVGLCLIVAGLVVRWLSIARLWRYFTVDVAISPDHRLLTSGIYGIIRHPSYLGSIVSFLGLGVALSSWIALLLIAVPVTGSFLGRIVIEEKALREAFGEEYLEYCERTKRLVPFLY
jgi:protein-S-isoprenylcysteine O-methyltransferase Ste14